MKETLRDQLARMNTQQAYEHLETLTRNELFKASNDPELFGYQAYISLVAAHRYFHGK